MGDRDDLIGRAEAGEWLKPGLAAVALGVGRKTVYNMCRDGRLRYRLHGGGKQRLIDPESVLARLRAAPESAIGYADRRGTES